MTTGDVDLSAPSWPRWLRRTIGLLAVAGFVASLVVHLLTFAPRAAVSMHSRIWWLHVAVFPLVLALILASRAGTRGLPRAEVNRRVLRSLPGWARLALLLALCYAIANFGLFMVNTGGAAASRSGGGHVLTVHGRVIRQVTEEEASRNEAETARGFSGHWMFFYLFPAVFFLARKEEAPSDRGA